MKKFILYPHILITEVVDKSVGMCSIYEWISVHSEVFHLVI